METCFLVLATVIQSIFSKYTEKRVNSLLFILVYIFGHPAKPYRIRVFFVSGGSDYVPQGVMITWLTPVQGVNITWQKRFKKSFEGVDFVQGVAITCQNAFQGVEIT